GLGEALGGLLAGGDQAGGGGVLACQQLARQVVGGVHGGLGVGGGRERVGGVEVLGVAFGGLGPRGERGANGFLALAGDAGQFVGGCGHGCLLGLAAHYSTHSDNCVKQAT